MCSITQPRPHTSIPILLLSSLFALTSSTNTVLRQGFVGPYHPTNENIPDSTNTTVWNTFHFGMAALQNSNAERSHWLLKDDLDFHCNQHDVNSLMAILIPPSEKGVINNPQDTALYTPATPPGLVQGAARFSKLAAVCPQLTGIVVDDFLQNYAGNLSGSCVPCPATHPYPYGNPSSGEFCCPWPLDPTGHCQQPTTPLSTQTSECCIKPGSQAAQCQGYVRCGVNPNNETACNISHYEKTITLHDVMQIKGALLGMDMDPVTGVVDLTSTPKTPWLRLFIVWYTRFTAGYSEDGLLSGSIATVNDKKEAIALPIVDGVSLWIEGPQQSDDHLNWTNYVHQFRGTTNPARGTTLPTLALYGGAYIEHSQVGILKPEPYWSIFNQSLELYDKERELEGFFIFAGSSIPKLNQTMWKAWDLEGNMNALYQPYLGGACGTVAVPYENVRVTVTMVGGAQGQRVTSKFARTNGSYCFDGWAGYADGIMYDISVDGNATRTARVALEKGVTKREAFVV